MDVSVVRCMTESGVSALQIIRLYRKNAAYGAPTGGRVRLQAERRLVVGMYSKLSQ